uniref:Immunoglobulin domain-containing protein n=1 Tax=Cyprinus carpio TaxID=7962 RepID=A0A8C2GZF0_CYPCA
MEGESVTLQNDALVERDDLIVWRFGDKGIIIAKIDVETKEISLNDDDERFRDRLQLNQNGSLIIKKTKTENAGFYELQIRGRESSQRFLLSVTAVPRSGLSPGLIAGSVVAILLLAAVLAAVVIYYRRRISKLKKKWIEEKEAMEGDSIILPTGLAKLQTNKIKWYYQDEKNCIAEINRGEKKEFPGADERFRGKLKLDVNGNLTITDIRRIHSGLYILEIHNNEKMKECKIFAVSVKVRDVLEKKGDEVLLKTTAEIQEGDLLLWMFGAEKSLVATNVTWPNKTGENLRGNKHLEKTGCLSIKNITTKDAGHYKLQIINSKKTECRRFNVTVTDEKKEIMEGNSIILPTGLAKLQTNDKIQWYYQDEKNCIAEINGGEKKEFPGADERFRGKLKLDVNGNLTIMGIRSIDSGLYILEIHNNNETNKKCKTFAVSVKVEEKEAMEGDSIILPTGLTALRRNKIQWYYQNEKNCIAEINGGGKKEFPGADERFRGKLTLHDNGDLTITDIRRIHSGLYILEIHNNNQTIKFKTFAVSVKVEEKEAMEGDSIILPTGLAKLQTNKIKWYYQDEKNCIAEINGGEKKEFLGADERFRGKLKLNDNGDLTITDIRRIHSGRYILEIHNNNQTIKFKTFAVSVKGEFMKS